MGATAEKLEQQKSFNPLASVNMMRYDLAAVGHVLPETMDRICDEEISFLAEGVDRAARTSFALQRSASGELQYFTKGAWRPYTGMLLTGQATNHTEAANDYRRKFLADRSDHDLYMGYQMQKLKPGQKISWYSGYPYEVEAKYGAAFVKDCGFIPERMLGFLYQATCQADGSVMLESQTVDRSDDNAFAAALSPEIQEAGLDAMVDAYDHMLSRKYGGQFYAGKLDSEKRENAWKFIREQKDLISYLLDRLKEIAESNSYGLELETEVKKHIYGVWAAFKNRLDGYAPSVTSERSIYGYSTNYTNTLALEVQGAFNQFVSEGRVLVGCGGSINMLQGEENVLNANSQDVFDAIFGRASEDSGPRDKFGSRWIKCPKGHKILRPHAETPDDFLTHCTKPNCKASLRCG